MKGFGIFFLVLALINLVAAFGALANGMSQQAATSFQGMFITGIIGGALIYTANRRKREKEEKDKWNNS